MWTLRKKEVKDDTKTFDLSNMKNGVTCSLSKKDSKGRMSGDWLRHIKCECEMLM